MSWSAKSLDELGTVSRGRSRHRPRDAAHLYGGPYPFVQTGDVKRAGLYLTEYSQTYSDEGLAQSKLWPSGTLCITIAANIADTSILAIDACFPDSVIGFIPDPKKSDARFIKYLFDAVLKLQYRQVSQGAAQDNLSQGKLLALKFSVPDDVNEQIRIADFIATYDDLIENNRRRIQLLEESARLLYQEWFVHLRFPGHEQVNTVDGLPEGWRNMQLTDIAKVNQASLKKGFDEKIEYIDISCVSTHSISDTTWYEFIDAPGRARRIVQHCDILWSCVRPNRRSHALVWEPHDRLIASTGFAVISATEVSPLFLYQSLTTNEYVGYLTNRAGGAAYPAVTARVFEESSILVPTKNLVEQYERQVQDTYTQINILRTQNIKLAQARDLLLPKLMSGELAV
ncbi:restriction endonuclease subunit S [Vibrio cholerae]|jgi:type I restriction enzyme S subunit|uniref:restriction endonuclease subunit S n=1 Tax=Vibrio TaxID=662 RepID=UPI0011D35EFD|nr:restriction endonuclease subunit S [Vibrio cholerae]EKO3632800.1 restriction endonuclease subunit S [Vibrio metschnikovii]MBY7923939.1 restriction endonuclease subunit S [Vibrio fluvialis]EMA2410299.1 restriction endonuclease subunit S [Vibrio cholerae]MBY7979595.1 restriction endonuclease subunit S [Vibrio fluvialis]MDV2350568.1 restriction endonuclease subunit S [Vibrio cholerae]